MTDEDRPDAPTPLPAGWLEAASDPELIQRVRAGDAAAYEQLFLRHRDIAIRYARRISDSGRAEDLCAEAFAKILDLLQRGKGPDVAFRAYLLTTVRTSHLNTIRAGSREELVGDHEPISRMTPVTDDPDARFDRETIFRAFAHLPTRWQAALWMTEVEGMSNEEAGALLDIKANAVASLAFRARAGLRRAYLAEHLLDAGAPECRRIVELLPNHLRGRLSTRRRTEVDQHLATCAPCTTAALELTDVNARLGALLAPLGLTAAAAAGIGPASAGSLGAMFGSLKGSLAAALTQLKGWASGTPWMVGAKVVVVASVAAAGVAVGAHALNKPAPVKPEAGVHAPGATTSTGASGQPLVDGTTVPTPGVATPLTPGASPIGLATPTASPTGTPSQTPTGAASVTASESASPTPGKTPSTPVAARSMAVSGMHSSLLRRGALPWDRVTVQLSDVVEGTRLRLTSTRTYKASVVGGDGWSCGLPTMSWVDGQAWASTTTVCTYLATSGGGPVQVDYQVAKSAVASATLIPPAGVEDASTSDNSGSTAMS